MAKANFQELPLVEALKDEVSAWASQGWPGVTQTTYELLSYWFNRGQEAEERFYNCQKEAIETIIYCHEVLQPKNLLGLYQRISPETLATSISVKKEIGDIPFSKYALKMATGTGKTWVLGALLVWQYFNSLNNGNQSSYSSRFLIVAPGHEVLARLLGSFKGKRDPKTGNRVPAKADYARSLFMPEGSRWRERFNLEIFEPSDVRANTTPPEGPFVFLTNWQQFRLSKDKANLWDQYTGADIEEQPRGEVIAEFLSEFPDLVIMNDEAHHVHGKKTSANEELVWRKFINYLYGRLKDKHKEKSGLFLQIDYSATPFYGSGKNKDYFPHIVYDYDLVEAMREMLVKQIFLEERQSIAGEKLKELDFRAKRTEPEGRKWGEIIDLSEGQKLLLDIGLKKLEQIAEEFRQKELDQKPVLFVLAEENKVADLVEEHLWKLTDEKGRSYKNQVLKIHSDVRGAVSDEKWSEIRAKLENLDLPEKDNPTRIVVSVLMLREGFDTRNVCVTVVLRASEADLLLEQIVGRGLRLIFPENEYPELWEAKKEAAQDIRRNKTPSNSLDFLFVVEHPKFRVFYDELRKQGYLIGEGDTSEVSPTGDIIPIEAEPARIEKYDIYWPAQVFEQGKLLELSQIDIASLPKYQGDFSELKKYLSKLSISDVFTETGGKVKTWKLGNKYFDYNHFLRQASLAIAHEGKGATLTGKQAEIASLVDDYATNYLFGKRIEFFKPENYQILNYTPVFDFVVKVVRAKILDLVENVHFEPVGNWEKLSSVEKIMLRERNSLEVERCIYPRISFAAVGGGFERDFIMDTLNKSAEIEAFCKIIERKHKLCIGYRDKDGIKRDYWPDFIAKTEKEMFIIETKADKDIDNPMVAIKARAAKVWCDMASSLTPPSNGITQPQNWNYLLLSEKLFHENQRLSFSGMIPLCLGLCEQVVKKGKGKLF